MHEEMKAKLEPIKKMKEKLITLSNTELEKGCAEVDTKEMGDVIDMIKDLAEAEKSCWAACYYEKVVEAMEEETEEPMMPFGYNPNRSMTTGRYTRGYRPMPDFEDAMMSEMPYVDAYLTGRMGYTGSSSGGRSGPSRGGSMGRSGQMGGSSSGYTSDEWYPKEAEDELRNGKAFRDWQKSRRHYTETGSKTDKDEMSLHASEHVAATIATMREIWKEADPEMKKRMKKDLEGLVGEMN